LRRPAVDVAIHRARDDCDIAYAARVPTRYRVWSSGRQSTCASVRRRERGMKTGLDVGNFTGGEAGIRTLDTAFRPYNGLANRRLQPLGHLTDPVSIRPTMSCGTEIVPAIVLKSGN